MNLSSESSFMEPSHESGMAFVSRQIKGSVVMLNLLRFREVADYSSSPELAPLTPITGEQAYQRYVEHTQPFLQQAGGELLFLGAGGRFLIGPPGERWDLVLLVRHRDVETFISFASDGEYLAGMGHRTAALDDSRLLPLIDNTGSQT